MKDRQLAAFQAVMNYGGVGRAAAMLNITQPAVSRLITALETDVGFVLFEREGRGMTPTQEAELLKREVDMFFLGMDRVKSAAKSIREASRAQLRIATIPAVAIALAPQIIEKITIRYPTADVTLDVHTAPRIADLVGAGQYDLGLLHHDQPRADIEELGHWTAKCVCVVSKEHELASKDAIHARDLTEVPMVLLSHRTSTAKKLQQYLSSHRVRPVCKVEVQPSYAAFALAAQGVGVTVIDELTANSFHNEAVVIKPFATKVTYDFKLIRPLSFRPSLIASESSEIAISVLNSTTKLKAVPVAASRL